MSSAIGDNKESKPSTSFSKQHSRPCRHFEFHEILIATENFDESLVIGRGGFGKVYKGNVIIGTSLVVVAIKRLDSNSNQGATEFWAEVEMLSMLRHCNLVSLIGHCNHENEMILVYEYMCNGTLDDHLHKLHTSLSWIQRLRICIGAGRGLHYLHTGTGIESSVIHRDVKSSNILLHESWAAKVSDFGLSKIGPTNQAYTDVITLIKGTFGYLDPNYYATGKLTRKSNVYAFGVVLLEVLCRKRAVDSTLDEDQWCLVAWVQDSIKDGNIKHIIDSDIRGEISPKGLKEFVRITDRCLHNSPKQRPTMAEVVVSLECLMASQEKFNILLQSTRRTIFGRIVNLFPFFSDKENSVQGDSNLSNNSKGNNMLPEIKKVPAPFLGPNPSVKVCGGVDSEKATTDFSPDSRLGEGGSGKVKVFEFVDLQKATRNFSLHLRLGDGGFRNVFLGWVEQNTLAPSEQGVGLPVAVKRQTAEISSLGFREWVAESSFLQELIHPNIIRLLGYCQDELEHLLVYEQMPNKNFDDFLFKAHIEEHLSWGTRLLIMIGVSRGLTYLHLKKVIHRDLKPSNIILDEDFNAKLWGLGLARYGSQKYKETHVSTRVMGTYGYAAPEYIATGHLTTKCDIYSLGMVLLESITGRRAFDRNLPEGQQNLMDWVSLMQSKGRNVNKIMDSRLDQHMYPQQGASKCLALALRCLVNQPKNRPSSEEVLRSLEQIYACSSQIL